MQHSFNTEIATECGIEAAVILNNIIFWCEKNRANFENYFENRFWTYNTVKAWQQLFPYMLPKRVRNALETLRKDGYLLTGRFNKKGYDRTLWYAPTDKALALYGVSICPDRQKDLPTEAKGFAPEGEPIPDINTDNKPDVNTERGKRTSRFIPPSEFEVSEFITELKNSGEPVLFTARAFIKFYEARNWMIGKNKMSNWKAAVWTWIERDKKEGKVRAAPQSPEDKRAEFDRLCREAGV
jgi:hypothetical protein